jgi:plasmid maintenance system antidote protein VapI
MGICIMPARSAAARARKAGRQGNGKLTLKQFCALKELKDKDLARLFNIHLSHANRIRRGKARAGPDLAYRISEFTGGRVPLEALLYPTH